MNDTDFQLAQQIAELKGTVSAGFSAINSRLDVSNGRLAKHDKLIAELYESDATDRGRDQGRRGLWNIFVTLASLIIALLAILLR